MKWSFGVVKTNECRTYWEELQRQGWYKEWGGLRKFRVANIEEAVVKETGRPGWVIECQSNFLEYLCWLVTLGKKRGMILKGWLSEKGKLKR